MLGVGLVGIPFIVVMLILAWSLPWKGYALWLAARNRHVVWFIVLLLVNTIAILDIVYIFAVGRPAEKKNEGSKEQ